MRHIRGKSDLKQKLNVKLELDSPAERFAYATAVCHLRAHCCDFSWQPLGFSVTSLSDNCCRVQDCTKP